MTADSGQRQNEEAPAAPSDPHSDEPNSARRDDPGRASTGRPDQAGRDRDEDAPGWKPRPSAS
jgi:hypothetical protein